MQHVYDRCGIVGWPSTIAYAIVGCLAANLNILFTGEPGCAKTKFAQDICKLLGYTYRTYEMDKLTEDTFYGSLNPSWLGQTSKALLNIRDVVAHMAGLKTMTDVDSQWEDPGQMYVDTIFDYDVLIFDEILRAPPNIQALLLRVYQDKEFAGRPVNSLRISATNRGTDDLYEWNEPLLNRYHLIVEAPHLRDMTHEDSDRVINECGPNKLSLNVENDPEFRDKFDKLSRRLSDPENVKLKDITRVVRQFVKHLKNSLMGAIGTRFSGRAVDNIVQVLSVTIYTYSGFTHSDFEDIPREDLWGLMKDTFMSTIYLHDLDDDTKGAVRNAFFLAFGYTFDVEKLTLETRISSVPSFDLNCEDFFEHIKAHANEPDNQDLVGISMFLRKLRKECENDEPKRYMLYKWLVPKIDKYGVFAEKDLIDPIRNKLSSMQKKIDGVMETQAKLKISSATLNSAFLQEIKAADANKVFSDTRRDPKLWAALVTAVQVFDEEKPKQSEQYLSKTFSMLAHLHTLKETEDNGAEEDADRPALPDTPEDRPELQGP